MARKYSKGRGWHRHPNEHALAGMGYSPRAHARQDTSNRELERVMSRVGLDTETEYSLNEDMNFIISKSGDEYYIDLETSIPNPLFDIYGFDIPDEGALVLERQLKKYEGISFDPSHLDKESWISIRFSRKISPEDIDRLSQIEDESKISDEFFEMVNDVYTDETDAIDFREDWLYIGNAEDEVKEQLPKSNYKED